MSENYIQTCDTTEYVFRVMVSSNTFVENGAE